MYSTGIVYKIQTKDNLYFTAKILEEDIYSIKIVSVIDGEIDILHKDNILKARPAVQNNTGDNNGKSS